MVNINADQKHEKISFSVQYFTTVSFIDFSCFWPLTREVSCSEGWTLNEIMQQNKVKSLLLICFGSRGNRKDLKEIKLDRLEVQWKILLLSQLKAVGEDHKFSVEVCEREEIRELGVKAQSGCNERSILKLEPAKAKQ